MVSTFEHLLTVVVVVVQGLGALGGGAADPGGCGAGDNRVGGSVPGDLEEK